MLGDAGMDGQLLSDAGKALGTRGLRSLPPSHRPEYVRWIDEAKRPSTRAERIEEMVCRLTRGGAR